MSWRRYDDGYEEHPKILELIEIAGPWAYYRLGKIHGYCARNRTNGRVPKPALRELGVTPKMLAAMLTVGLLDDTPDGLFVHDWDDYNPQDSTAAERMRRHRARNADRNADRNDAVTGAVTPPVTKPLPRAGASAGVPVPSPSSIPKAVPLEPQPTGTSNGAATQPATDSITRLIVELRDADRDTPAVIRSFAGRLPDAAFETAREQILEARSRTGPDAIRSESAYAVDVLKLYESEGRYSA